MRVGGCEFGGTPSCDESGERGAPARSESWSAYVGVRSPIVDCTSPARSRPRSRKKPSHSRSSLFDNRQLHPLPLLGQASEYLAPTPQSGSFEPDNAATAHPPTCLDSVTESMTFFPQSPTPRAIASTFNVNHWQSHNPFLNAHQVRGRLNDYIYYQSPVTPPVFPSILTDPLQFPRERLSQDSIFTLAKILKTRRSWKTCIRLRKRR